MIPAQADLQIIAGEGRCPAGIGIFTQTEGEGAELAGAALDDGAGDFVRKGGSFGAGTLGKRENVEISEGEALDEAKRGGVVVFRFAGEAGDDVGADGGVRKAFMDEFDAAGVVFGAVPAVHGGENTIGA